MYDVFFTKRVLKQVKELPTFIQKKLAVLVDDLREKGPIREVYYAGSRENAPY